MLTSDTNFRFDSCGSREQCIDWAHFEGFRSGSDDRQDPHTACLLGALARAMTTQHPAPAIADEKR